MSFFKFKLDNACPQESPVPTTSSRLSSPDGPEARLERSAPAPHLSHDPSSDEPGARQGLRHGTTLAAVPVSHPDVTLSWSDGRKKKPALDSPAALDMLFRPWSMKEAGARKSTSCNECKLSKTRCEKVLSEPEDVCSRCLRLSKQCIFDPKPAGPVPKSPAKPSAFKSHDDTTFSSEMPERREPRSRRPDRKAPRPQEQDSQGESTYAERAPRTCAEASSTWSSGRFSQPPMSSRLPSVGYEQTGLRLESPIGREEAERIFRHYVDAFAPKCPMVIFKPGTSLEHVRETRPLLLLSILSVASDGGHCSLDQQKELLLRAQQALGERAIDRREQSLELVQALQVTLLWYRAPGDRQRFSPTQLTYIMVTMAFNLGLDRVDLITRPDQDTWARAEVQRAWLACFLLCNSNTLLLRRHMMMTWTSEMDAYLHDLQRSQASPSDAFFCELIRTEKLCYDVDQHLLISDRHRSAPVSNFADLAARFQSRIDSWTSCCQLNRQQQALVDFGKFSSSLYAHEPAMHVGHNIDEFEAPFTPESLQTCAFIGPKIDTSQLMMLRRVVTASHGILNCFLNLSLAEILALSPQIYGGRLIYSLIVLCKLYKAVAKSTRDVTQVLLVDDLHLGKYLDRLNILESELRRASSHHALYKSLFIVKQLKKWYDKNRHQPLSSSVMLDERNLGGQRGQNEQPQLPLPAHPPVQRQHDAPSDEPLAATHVSLLPFPRSLSRSGYEWFSDEMWSLDELSGINYLTI